MNKDKLEFTIKEVVKHIKRTTSLCQGKYEFPLSGIQYINSSTIRERILKELKDLGIESRVIISRASYTYAFYENQ